MDAAQMLTAHEIARECEQLARAVQRRGVADSRSRRHLRLADPVTQPIERITEPVKEEPVVPAQPAPADSVLPGLTERETQVLAFERQWWKRSGAKEHAILELFGLSASRYYQVLNGVLDKPAALRADPMLIKRLRRVRASKQRARAARQLGIEPR